MRARLAVLTILLAACSAATPSFACMYSDQQAAAAAQQQTAQADQQQTNQTKTQ